MTTARVSRQFIAGFGDAFRSIGERAGKSVSFMALPSVALTLYPGRSVTTLLPE